MFMLIAVISIVILLASFAYLVEFARASRRDSLFLPASSGGARRARRVTGVYTRGPQEELTLVGAAYRE
ncbi:hypothetical protein DPM19_32775 [Actinomadura craniellae]|uniref:Uncharacterized protein n=1 Tax=Actinomadura craniellae TaxID=2231787 RepID=A0A365GVV5_9ACTN|nr:hypothetical protein [Actinomadura craniellae]RAY10915.1 hypothetical protein DPM19_32775 [Actinomadura craniellae]